VVNVNDPAFRLDLLRDFVGTSRVGNAGADIQELRQPGLAGQEPDRPAKKIPVRACRGGCAGIEARHRVGVGAVRGEVVFSAKQVVIDPGMMRDAGIERRVVADGVGTCGAVHSVASMLPVVTSVSGS
jgi:hypothetical protein